MASTHGALQKGGVAQSKCKNTMYRICTLKRAGGGLKTRTSAKKNYKVNFLKKIDTERDERDTTKNKKQKKAIYNNFKNLILKLKFHNNKNGPF